MRTNTTEGVRRRWSFGRSRRLGADQDPLGAHRDGLGSRGAGRSGTRDRRAGEGSAAGWELGRARCAHWPRPPRRAGCRAMAAAANAPRAGWPRTAPRAGHAGRAPRRPSWPHCRGRRAGRAGPPSRCRAEAAPTQGPRASDGAAPAQGPHARVGTRPRRNRAQATRVGPPGPPGPPCPAEPRGGRAESRERERDVRGIGEGEKEVGERGWG
jgi:hypothetical protein